MKNELNSLLSSVDRRVNFLVKKLGAVVLIKGPKALGLGEGQVPRLPPVEACVHTTLDVEFLCTLQNGLDIPLFSHGSRQKSVLSVSLSFGFNAYSHKQPF
jgi:hypothetical protein